jgi:hypothetical protein
MKKAIPTLLFLISTLPFFAQSLSYEDLGILFSQEDFRGTARLNAMGGAFGALGGEISAIYGNPAGAAVFNHNEISGSIATLSTDTNSRYSGTETFNNYSNFRIPQFGAVFVFDNPNRYSHWNKFSVGLSYNITNDYSNSYTTQGNNGYATFLEHPYDDRTPISSYDTAEQQVIANDLKGYSSVFSFSFSGNYKKSFYFGASLNAHQVDLVQNTYLSEQNGDGNGNALFADFDQSLSELGEGFSLSFGLIAKPTEFLRLGLSYQSPIWYHTITEESTIVEVDGFEGVTVIETTDIDGTYSNYSYPMEFTFLEYSLQTPSKITTSIACVYKKHGLISVDYSLQNFKTIELGGNQDFSPENMEFNRNLREDVQSLKIGTEWNFKEWSVRGGYAYQDAPFQNTNSMSNVETYSLGLGYRMKQSKFDISYQTSARNEVYDFYGQYPEIAPTKLAIDNSIITATFSFFF